MRKVTHEEFLEKLNKVNSNVEVLGIYVKAQTKIKVKCKICGNEWEVTPNNLLNGKGCPECGKQKTKQARLKSIDEFVEEANIIHNFKYDYSKFQYTSSHIKGTVICPIHGEFEITPANHLSGKQCPKCALEQRTKIRSSTTEEFIEKAKKVHGYKYNYSKAEYINNHIPIIIICSKHGEFLQQPNNHLQGKGCPMCRESHGEQFVRSYLKQHSIDFTPQYKIEIDKDINSSGNAYIDFYIESKNIFIEYNGIQHYIEKQSFGGKLEFERQQKRDEFIRNYCKQNNIRLLEIPYTLEWEEVTKLLNTALYE